MSFDLRFHASPVLNVTQKCNTRTRKIIAGYLTSLNVLNL